MIRPTYEQKENRARKVMAEYLNLPEEDIKICRIFERSFTYSRKTEYIYVVAMVEIFSDWNTFTVSDISVAESVVKRYKEA